MNELAKKILADIQDCEKSNHPYTIRAKGFLVDAAIELNKLDKKCKELMELIEDYKSMNDEH
jgi:hypothetical protein